LSKRKQFSGAERRKEHVELNLMAESEARGPLAKARRGCALPFLGGSLLVIALGLLHTLLA
jgi:hypothetical protein